MKRLTVPAWAGVLLCLAFAPAQAVDILRWERLPLSIALVVGQERVVFIDRNVRVGVPEHAAAQLRVQSAGGAIYLHASEALPPTRLHVQDVESGALLLLDVTADATEDGHPLLEPVRIVQVDTTSAVRPRGEAPPPEQPASKRETPVSVVLTRYAAQHLYAPLRTVEPVAGITVVHLRRTLVLDTLLPSLPVQARALAAWRLEDQWVTAVQLRNATARWIDLDPRALQGDFVAATFQHPNLGPVGESADTTVVYLVTRGHGLAESLLPRLSPIDATVNLPPAGAAGLAAGGTDEK